MLLGTLSSSLTGNLLTGKRMYRASSGNKCNCHQGKGLFRAGQGVKKIVNASTSFKKH